MTNSKRQAEIIKLIEQKGTVRVEELASLYQISASTIRRDLQELARLHKIIKVQGGALAVNYSGNIIFDRADQEYRLREAVDQESKIAIARYAAGLIRDGDVIYLDASTSVASMVPFLPMSCVYITNSPTLARKLAERDLKVLITGGEYKLTTDAYTGAYALEFLNRFNFNIGFFGTNGIHRVAQFTTPDPTEAAIKRKAFERTYRPFILATASKFNKVASVTFAQFAEATVITDVQNEEYRDLLKLIDINEVK